MSADKEQVVALKQAILDRAKTLAQEHIHQGSMTAEKILQDARDKIKLMEQKEMLSAKVKGDREYQRKVQASELRMQAEQDRNRWGLVQSVLDSVKQQIFEIYHDKERYEVMFRSLLKQCVNEMGSVPLMAHLNSRDIERYAGDWKKMVEDCCGKEVNISLSGKTCHCSGGFKLYSESGDMMLDYTFEGILQRKDSELQRLIFERLFSTRKPGGGVF